jgi:hypothetical protein
VISTSPRCGCAGLAGTFYVGSASSLTRVQIDRTVSCETPQWRATLRSPSHSARAATSGHRSGGMRGSLATVAYRPIPDRCRNWSSRSEYRNGIRGSFTTSISRHRSPSLPPPRHFVGTLIAKGLEEGTYFVPWHHRYGCIVAHHAGLPTIGFGGQAEPVRKDETELRRHRDGRQTHPRHGARRPWPLRPLGLLLLRSTLMNDAPVQDLPCHECTGAVHDLPEHLGCRSRGQELVFQPSRSRGSVLGPRPATVGPARWSRIA